MCLFISVYNTHFLVDKFSYKKMLKYLEEIKNATVNKNFNFTKKIEILIEEL